MLRRNMGLCGPPLRDAACGAAGPRQLGAFEYPLLPPCAISAVRPSRFWRFVELAHHAAASVSSYALDPVASDGKLQLHYECAVGVALFNEPQLFCGQLGKQQWLPSLTCPRSMRSLPRPGGILFPSFESQAPSLMASSESLTPCS